MGLRRRASRDRPQLQMVQLTASQSREASLAPRRSPVCESAPFFKFLFSQLSSTRVGPISILHVRYSNCDNSEDGTIDHTGAAKAAGAHKLGPKANQGAINAGLRALDRSGKPCRKWDRGGFKLKSFTGVVWEVPRWTAPPKKGPESSTEDSAAPSAADSSSKENKETGAENSVSNSNNGGDVEMQSMPSVNASSPAPMAIAAAS